MKFAIYIPNFGPFSNPQVMIDFATSAEQAGWDGFFIWDHIAGDGYPREMIDPWIALSSIALNTKKMKIGALVTPLPRRRPWKVARETVSLDHLSGGRLIFGAGSGGVGAEWDRFGEEPMSKVRGEMLDEGLDILTGLWSGESITFSGKHYKVENQKFLPAPLQKPRIPIWIAGKWPNKKPFFRAVNYDGVFPILENEPSYLNPSPEKSMREYSALSNWINNKIKPGKEIDLICRGNSDSGENSTTDAMINQYQQLGYTWWLEHLVPEIFGGAIRGDWPLARMLKRVKTGPPK